MAPTWLRPRAAPSATSSAPRRLAAFAGLLAALVALTPPALAQPGPGGPPAVGVVQAVNRSVTETSEFIGRVQAINRVDVVARVTAFLTERLFTEGAEIHTGDVLYRLERAPFEAQVAAQAATVAQAQALLQNNSQTLGRAQALLSTPAGQQSRVDDALAAQRSQSAQLAGAQAQLRLAQVNLDYTEITSPIDGTISRTAVTVGNVVGPTTGTLATIVSQDPMYVVFPISVRAALDLRDRYADKGGFSAVLVKLKLPSGRPYGPEGHLDYVDPTVAPNTDTLTLRARMPNPIRPGAQANEPGARELIDGEFATVLLQGVQPVQAVTIPRPAVLSDQEGSYVWVVGADNKAEQRRIQLGQSTPERAVISSGLKDGETVVVDGVQRVRPGIALAPRPANAPPALPPQGPKT